MALAPLNIAPVTDMLIRIVSDYGRVNEAYFEHNAAGFSQIATLVGGRLYEINIWPFFASGGGLKALDYFGVSATRQAGMNTNCYVLGVHMKYKYR